MLFFCAQCTIRKTWICAMENVYQVNNAHSILSVNFLGDSHRIIKKNFETEISIDGKKLPLNHMMQETLGNILQGFSKTLKGTEEDPERIEVKVKKLHQPVDVDAHTYP